MQITPGMSGSFGPWVSVLRTQQAESMIQVRSSVAAQFQLGIGPIGAETVITSFATGAGSAVTVAAHIPAGERVALRAASNSSNQIDVQISAIKSGG